MTVTKQPGNYYGVESRAYLQFRPLWALAEQMRTKLLELFAKLECEPSFLDLKASV